jgi:hypothetical protein
MTKWCVAALLASFAALNAQEPVPQSLSARNANYDIDVRLDHAARTLTGSETIRWRNIGTAPADSLRLHLYWNAWANNQSTWMREYTLAGGFDDVRKDDWSYIRVTKIALANADPSTSLVLRQAQDDPEQRRRVGASASAETDLMARFSYVQPDDGNPEDRTLAAVSLPSPVPPGGAVALRVEWIARVPRTFARTGAIGNFYFIAQWFPKLAVFSDTTWTAHQFHANSEFFSDYGRYDVRITVPAGWKVGATGTPQNEQTNGDNTVTHRFVQDDVHDFAWTTSPDYLEYRQQFRHAGLPPVEMRLLLQPEHRGQQDRHFAATAAALRYYGEWYGPYPYGHLTIVDPAYQSGAGGMEYPTLFTAGTRLFAPRQSSDAPEAVTVHETGHQFWYGIVGNNEFEHAWLDEGINQFSEARVLAEAFTPDYPVTRFFGGFVPWQVRDIPFKRETDGNYLSAYRSAAESDPMNIPTFRYHPVTHWAISYYKTALWLNTLERYLGWDTLQRVLKTHFQRSAFKHPRPEDFFQTLNEVSGRDLTWMVDQVYRTSNVFDYGVELLESERVQTTGFDVAAEKPAYRDATSDTTYRTMMIVRRHGEAIFPVDVLVTFANGEQIREHWDGVDRWKAYTYDRAARAVSAEVDPDRVLLLDVNYTNNSRSLSPKSAEAAQKWSLKWMVWMQDLMLTWSFFV